MSIELNLTTLVSVRNTSLCATDDSVQYHMETPFKWTKGTTTTITKWVGPKREVVATIDWKMPYSLPTTTFRAQHGSEETEATFTGEEKTFIQKIGAVETMNRAYDLIMPDGTKYVWHAAIRPELKRASDDHVVAKYKFAHLTAPAGGSKGGLVIEEEVVKYLDYVVASFVIVEHFREYSM